MKRLLRITLLAVAAVSALGACACANASILSTKVALQGDVHLVGDGQDKFCHVEKQGHLLHDVCHTGSAKSTTTRRHAMEAPEPSYQSAGYIAAGRPGL